MPAWLRAILEAAGVIKPTPKPVPPPPAPPAPSVDYQAELLRLHNSRRASGGAVALALNAHLNRAAVDYAGVMAKRRILKHDIDGTSYFSRAKDAGYQSASGENIAKGYGTPSIAFNAWVNSSGHLANILRQESRDVGFGMAVDSTDAPYWCAVFGYGSGASWRVAAVEQPEGLVA